MKELTTYRTKRFMLRKQDLMKLTPDGYTIIARPQDNGLYGVFCVNREGEARPQWILCAKDEITHACKCMCRNMDKFWGIGGDMSSAGRIRQKQR